MNNTLVIRNTHAIFGDQPGRRVDIVITGDKISEISSPNSIHPHNFQVIDGTNKYAFPGLINNQIHLSGNELANIDPKMNMKKIVAMLCNEPATFFEADRMGFIREGYFANLILVDFYQQYTTSRKPNALYNNNAIQFLSKVFNFKVTHVFENGHPIAN